MPRRRGKTVVRTLRQSSAIRHGQSRVCKAGGRPKGALLDEENAALLRRAWAAYDRGDEEEFAACLTDDWREHTPSGEVATLADELKTMAAHRIAFPDKHTDILIMVAADD